MKTFRWLLCLFAGILLAVALPAQQQRPGAKGKAEQKKKAEEAEEMGTIAGMEIARPNGQFLGLTIEGGQWKLTFYNQKKKPVPADVTRALARWTLPMKGDFERAVLNPGGDPSSFVGNRFVRPPYAFQLFLTLVRGEGDAAESVETYSLNYRG